MHFQIRAIARGPSIRSGARAELSSLLGSEVGFRCGNSLTIRLPSDLSAFSTLSEPDRLLCALGGWSRVFRCRGADDEEIHVIAAAEAPEGRVEFLRLRVRQRYSRRERRKPVEILDGTTLDYDGCASWLLGLRRDWVPSRDVALIRPSATSLPSEAKVAWVGPQSADGKPLAPELEAIGAVYGARLKHVNIQSYAWVSRDLRSSLPLDSVVICNARAPYLNESVVPREVREEFIHICQAKEAHTMLSELASWIDILKDSMEERRDELREAVPSTGFLLASMLRGMYTHSKIGQFSHCSRDTLLTGVRARRLNVASASALLDQNSELYQDRSSEMLFLWKEHAVGRVYFLNPAKVTEIEALLARYGYPVRARSRGTD